MKDLRRKIIEVPNWPIDGVSFKDITALFEDKNAFRKIVNLLSKPHVGKKVDKVVGIDARGFLIAAPVAYKLNAGLCMVRKPGKLPRPTVKKKFTLEYGSSTLEMHKDAVLPGEKILLMDDVVATGGTAVATCDIIKKLGGEILEIGVVIDLLYLGGSKMLNQRGYNVRSLIAYEN